MLIFLDESAVNTDYIQQIRKIKAVKSRRHDGTEVIAQWVVTFQKDSQFNSQIFITDEEMKRIKSSTEGSK